MLEELLVAVLQDVELRVVQPRVAVDVDGSVSLADRPPTSRSSNGGKLAMDDDGRATGEERLAFDIEQHPLELLRGDDIDGTFDVTSVELILRATVHHYHFVKAICEGTLQNLDQCGGGDRASVLIGYRREQELLNVGRRQATRGGTKDAKSEGGRNASAQQLCS